MAQVEGLTPEELEEQGAILEEAVAAALAVVAASAAAEVLAVPAGVAPTVLAAPWVSLDDLAVMATQWLKLLDSDIMPVVRETVDDTAGFVRLQIVEALPTLYGQPEDNELDVAVPTEVPPIPDVTADLIMQGARNRLVGIGDIVWANARQQLADGIREGDSIQQLADRVRTAAAVSEPRARTIARTEVAPSSNGAAIAQARSAGVPMRKIWIETPDDRTRLTHKHEPIGAGGQIRDLDEPFDVGGFLLDFPGDPTGPPQEVINERCAIGFLLGAGGPVVAARIRRYVRDDVGRFAETPGGGTGGADLRRTLGRLKVAELQQRAKTSGLKGLSKARKADLVEAIAAHDEAQARGVPMAAKTPVRTAPKSVGIPSRGTLSPDEIKRAKDLISRDPTIFATAQERFGRTVYAGNLSKADEDWLESVFKREPGLANYLAQQRQVARDQRDAAKKAGQSLPEYRRVTAARLKDWLSDKPIATRVTNEGALRDIVSSGRFKTSFEGSARGAGLFADLKTRRLGEEIHGIPADTPNAERPVYGYVAVNGVEPALSAGRKIEGIREREGQEDVLSAYGKIQVILKPDVRERTFVTVGDSLDEVAFKAPSPIDDPSADSISGGEFENRWGPFQDPDWTRRQYVEAQIRDGVGREDIAEVVFADQPSAPTVAALEAAGIPWQVLKPGSEHVPVTASRPARRTTAPKPRAVRVSPLESAALRRQATIDKARARGDVLADVEAWLLTGADVSRVARTIDAAAETRGVDRDRSVAAVLRAVATGDRRKVRASLGRAYKALKLERIGPDDDSTVVRFDPSQHELIDGPGARPAARPGVELVRPGFATTVGGERVVLSKAIVEETDRAVTPPISPPARAPAAELPPLAHRDISADFKLLRNADQQWRSGMYADSSDAQMTALAVQAGVDKPPTKVSTERLAQELAAGGMPLWRGVKPNVQGGRVTEAASEMVTRFREGPIPWYGNGVRDNGIYFSNRRERAEKYAGSGDGALMHAVLRADARVIDNRELETLYRRAWDEDRIGLRRTDEGGFAGDQSTYILDNPGRYAMALGYDAVSGDLVDMGGAKTGETYISLLNRAATLIPEVADV